MAVGDMGFLGDLAAYPERRRLLESMTVKELKALAAQFDIDVKPKAGIAGLGEPDGKELLIYRLANDTKNLSTDALKEQAKVNSTTGSAKEPAQAQALQPQPVTTPTLASQKSEPMVSFDEVYSYLDRYRFISRYTNEHDYEIELAGALRERFGTIIRQFPVPGSLQQGGRTKSLAAIDLDCGGVGIELKYEIKHREWDNLIQQVESYKSHYGEKLIVLLIGTAPNAQENNVKRLAQVIAK